MAFQAGTQIRPELAQADYSGFVNAANIRAQAMMNLGEQIGSGIKKYQENKQITLEGLASLEGRVAGNPELLVKLENDQGDIGKAYREIQDGKINPKNVIMVNGFAASFTDQKLRSIQEQLEMDKLSLAQRQEARLEETSKAEVGLAKRRAELAEQELDLKQRIFSAEQKGDPVAAQQAQAKLDQTKAQTQEIKAKTEEIGKPKALTPTQRLDILKTEVNDVTFAKYLQELTQAKSIKGGEIHQKGLFNFDEDQIAAFDNILRAHPEFLEGMPQVVKDYYGVKSTPGGGNIVITKR